MWYLTSSSRQRFQQCLLLQFYGQNVLPTQFRLCSCGIMAEEFGLEPAPAKRAGLLHDLGKVLDHEVEGPRCIGADPLVAMVSPEIVHAFIEAHHADIEPNTVLDMLVMAADAISAARPVLVVSPLRTASSALRHSNAHERALERTYAMQAVVRTSCNG